MAGPSGAILRPPRGLVGPRSSKWRDAMLDAQALADRYVAAWNEADAAKRSSAIAALWAPDALGRSRAGGYAALTKLTVAAPGTSMRREGVRYRAAPTARLRGEVWWFRWGLLGA